MNGPTELARPSSKGCLLVGTNTTEGARIRSGEPGRKAGTDRGHTVGTTVIEGIPEGRMRFFVRGFRPAKPVRIALRGHVRETRRHPYFVL